VGFTAIENSSSKCRKKWLVNSDKWVKPLWLRTMPLPRTTTDKIISKLSEDQDRQSVEVDLTLILHNNVNRINTKPLLNSNSNNSNSSSHRRSITVAMPHLLQAEVSKHSREKESLSVETESFIYHTFANTFIF
jgi:hypothetical protein